MTLEYLEVMEEIKRNKCVKSFKSNTRIMADGTIEVTPKACGEPLQKDVKKVGRSKRYATTGKNPLTCVELKCPEEVADKVAFFQKELIKLTKDIAIEEPKMPEGEYLINNDKLKLYYDEAKGKVMVWLMFDVVSELGLRKELYNLTSEIDKCFVYNKI